MNARTGIASLLAVVLVASLWPAVMFACGCAAGPGEPVVNADQTVIMIWDAKSQTQHFIRQATFKSEAKDFGFLVPTPNEPELAESGDEAFPFLLKLTEPATQTVARPIGFGCGCGGGPDMTPTAEADVTVLSEKLVAGFNAVVLEASSSDALVDWLKEHGYAYSPEIEAWAKPYVDAGWKITALKVAKDAEGDAKRVSASALRMSFKTDRPLFPYREPDSTEYANELGARSRMLRIYFLADARYEGRFDDGAWKSSRVAWANKLSAPDRGKLLELLKLPESTGPAEFWLTEFEDQWPYEVARGDIYFSRDAQQETVERRPNIVYAAAALPGEVIVGVMVGAAFLLPRMRRFCRGRG